MNQTPGKKILVIGGSARKGSNTMKVVSLIEEELKGQNSYAFEIIDAATLKIPLPGTPYENTCHEELQKKVKEATGIILVSPEYHGGISSVLKLIIDNLGFPSTLATKPISLVGVAAGSIGAIKSIEQTRSICSHVGAVVLPSSISVANVNDHFDDQGKIKDAEVAKRIKSSVTILTAYIEKHICPAIALEAMIRKESKGI